MTEQKARSNPTPPALSAEQRRAAFERSLELRRARALVRARLASGEKLSAVWGLPEVQRMHVYKLLMALSGYGPKRSRALMERVGMHPAVTVSRVGVRQTEMLFSIVL